MLLFTIRDICPMADSPERRASAWTARVEEELILSPISVAKVHAHSSSQPLVLLLSPLLLQYWVERLQQCAEVAVVTRV